MGPLEKLYYVSVVVANDMKHIHTHAIGKKFDRIHSMCMEYYDKVSEDADTFVELAIEYDESVCNASYAQSILNYKPTNQTGYSWGEACSVISNCMQYYIDAMEHALTLGFDGDVNNLIEEYLRYWKKERNYKLKKRMELEYE